MYVSCVFHALRDSPLEIGLNTTKNTVNILFKNFCNHCWNTYILLSRL